MKRRKAYKLQQFSETRRKDIRIFHLPLWKRLFDILFSSIAILFLSPILIATAIAIRIESEGKIIYKSQRVGSNYQIFGFLKFRSMYANADKKLKKYNSLNQYASDNDELEVKTLPIDKIDDSENIEDDSLFVSDDYIIKEEDFLRKKSREHDGISLFLDILLVYLFLCVLFNAWRKEAAIHFPNAINILTISYVVWMLYILVVMANTPTREEYVVMGVRNWLLGTPVLYILSSLLADNPKVLKKGLILIGIFTITAFLKLLYQKFRWFDAAETEWLMNGSWYTHIISTGIRYFSIFSDAGNFGANME